MKKFTVLILTLVLTVMLVACSAAPDRQPALDAYSEAQAAFNEVATLINDNIDVMDENTVNICNDMGDVLTQCGEIIESDVELTQEDLDELIQKLNDAAEWSISAKAELEGKIADLG